MNKSTAVFSHLVRYSFILFWIFSGVLSITGAVDFSYEETTVTTVAFGSCHKRKYATRSNKIWKTIATVSEPDAFLWTGDAVYPPTRAIASVELLKDEYHQLRTNASLGYSEFYTTMSSKGGSIFGVWDDHDYGGNDVGHAMPEKQARASAYWDFLGHAAPDQGMREGLYYSVEWGEPGRRVKALFLDTRWHRGDHCLFPSLATSMPLGAGLACASRWLAAGLAPESCARAAANETLLGEDQWNWLEQELLSSNAQVHLIISSIQVLTTNPVMESWGLYPDERERLTRLLSGVAGAVVLSGDVHHGEILDPMPHKEHTWLEVTSSGLTHTCETAIYGFLCKPLLENYNRHRFDSRENYYVGKNYGTVEIDWDSQHLRINIHDEEGGIVLSTGSRTFATSNWSEREIKGVAPCLNGHLIPFVQTTLLGIAMTYFLFRNML